MGVWNRSLVFSSIFGHNLQLFDSAVCAKDRRIKLPGWQVFSYQYPRRLQLLWGSVDISEGVSITVRYGLLVPLRLFLESELWVREGIVSFFTYLAGSVTMVGLRGGWGLPLGWGLSLSFISLRHGVPRTIYKRNLWPLHWFGFDYWHGILTPVRLLGSDYYSKVLIATQSEMFFAVICFGFEYILPATSSVFPRFKDLIGANLFNVFAEQTLYFNYFFNRGDRVLATEFLELYDTFVLATMWDHYLYIYNQHPGWGPTWGVYSSWSDRLFECIWWGQSCDSIVNSECWGLHEPTRCTRWSRNRDLWLECGGWVDWQNLYSEPLKSGRVFQASHYWDSWEASYECFLVGDNITALGDSWLRMEFPGVSLGVYLGVYLRLVWTMLSVFCNSVIRVFFSGGYLFYYHFMHIMGLSYYVFQRGVFRVIEGSKRDFVSCHVFPVVVVDTMLKLNFLYSSFEVLYLLSNIGFFMCLWNGSVVYIYHFMDYSSGFFWMFFSVFFYVFRFFYTSNVFLFRSLDMLTRVHGFRFFIASCSFVPSGVGFVGVCETTSPSFLVKVLFGWEVELGNDLTNSFHGFVLGLWSVYWSKCLSWSYSLLDFVYFNWGVSGGLGLRDRLMCRYFLKQKRVVSGLNGGVYGLDEVCELAAMVESTNISCFIFLMLGVFFEIRGFSGKATPGLYSVLFSPWYSSAQSNIIVMANLYEKASYYEHTCMVFPSL